jgi:predicted O-methyltransferase YrrM
MKLLTTEIIPTEKEIALLEKISSVFKFSLMIKEERVFLTSLILKYQPKKILELGVASGTSSLTILNAAETYGGAKVYACDISAVAIAHPNF